MTELQWLSRLLLGTVFVVSGTVKLIYWRRFRDTLSAMEIFPRRLTEWISVVLPPVEILVGGSVFIMRRLPVLGPLLLILLLSFVIVLLLYRVRGGKELVCGCFADFERKTTTTSLILRNTLLLVSGLPLLSSSDEQTTGRGLDEWLMALSVVVGLLLAWSLLSRLAEIVLLLRDESSLDNS